MEKNDQEKTVEQAKKSPNIIQKVLKELKITVVYFYKVIMRAFKKRDFKVIIPIVIVLILVGVFIFRDPGLNKDEVLAELGTQLNLPQGDAEVRTVGDDDKIAEDDAFLTDSTDDFVIISYPGLDILYNQDTGEVVRSRSYAPGSL